MTTIESLIAARALRKRFANYVAAYVNDELDRGNSISGDTINSSINAFEDGAGDDSEGAAKGNNLLCTPWTLHFDRDGCEDFAIICDADGTDLARSRHFWLPEGDDPVPATLASMRLMVAAPRLLEACHDNVKVMVQAADLLRTLGHEDMAIALHMRSEMTSESIGRAA